MLNICEASSHSVHLVLDNLFSLKCKFLKGMDYWCFFLIAALGRPRIVHGIWHPLEKYLLDELIIGLVYSPRGLSKNLTLFIFYMTAPETIWDSCHTPQVISFPDKIFIVPWTLCEENPDPLLYWSFKNHRAAGDTGIFFFLTNTLILKRRK